MPERREGIEPQRAEQLERVLNGLFEAVMASGLGRSEHSAGLTMSEIIDEWIENSSVVETPADALMGYLDARAVSPYGQIGMAVICGELYGAGDLQRVEEELERKKQAREEVAL